MFEHVKIINHAPVLGIHGKDNNFKGWKRSIISALKTGRNYDYIVHNEYDLRVQNIAKFNEYIKKPGFYCAFCNTYNFIETACMILNDKSKNEGIINLF